MNAAAEIVARSGEGLKSGPLGLAVVLLLCVVCYFLFKSMSKHLKKVREEFPVDPSASTAPAQESAEPPTADTAPPPDSAGDGPSPAP